MDVVAILVVMLVRVMLADAKNRWSTQAGARPVSETVMGAAAEVEEVVFFRLLS